MKLSKRILAVMLACVMALCMLTACGGGGGGGTSGGSGSYSGDKATAVLDAINAVRKENGLSEVVEVEALDAMAAQTTFANVTDGDKTYVPATGLLACDTVSASDFNNLKNYSKWDSISAFACEDFDYIGISVSDSSFFAGYYIITMSGYRLK